MQNNNDIDLEMAGSLTVTDQPGFLGTPAQQKLQRAIADYYADDLRVLAVVIFGSLGRGTWHEHSDLDLDVVLADGVELDVLSEVGDLCASFASIGEHPLLIIPDGDDAADVVLASLRQLSIRYHPLESTSPNIVDSLRLLTGSLGLDAIREAGIANRVRSEISIDLYLDQLVRWTIDVANALRRGRFWLAWYVLQRMREHVLVIFSHTHNGKRPYRTFEAEASPELQARVGATLHEFGLDAARAAFSEMLDLIERDLNELGAGQLHLSASQAAVISQVRQRLEANYER